jgi:type IV secretory pathway TrbL component
VPNITTCVFAVTGAASTAKAVKKATKKSWLKRIKRNLLGIKKAGHRQHKNSRFTAFY